MSQNDNLSKQTKNNLVAVQCHNLILNYGQVSALNSASITISSGQIFALLGPSGCGKTTLLRCVLGRIKPQSGSVLVFGLPPDSEAAKVPGPDVGFMPQEVGLVQQFTIEDIITYFGRIYNMNLEEIKSRIEFLVKLLDLPDKKRKISTLSGGQQRRVSFAVAIVHQPKLLVLDEPTVGQDSLLRYTIWKHLKEMSLKQQTTILMTTHYVEEAGSADIVSMMRQGKILTQEKPMELVKQMSCLDLNEAFLKLYLKDKKQSEISSLKHPKLISFANFGLLYQQFTFEVRNKRFNKKPSLARIRTNLNKNIISLQKNPTLLILFLLFPALILIVVGTSGYGKAVKNIPIALFNAESNEFGFSQKFMEKLDSKMFIICKKPTQEEAVEMVRRGIAWLAISIHKNFTLAFERRFSSPEDVTDAEIDESTIKLYADMSNSLSPGVDYIMSVAYHRFLDDYLVIQHNYNPRTADVPIEIEGVYLMNKNVKENLFDDFSAVGKYGFGAMIVYAFPMLMTLHFVTFEREQSLIERSLVAGVRPAEILLAHLLTLLVLLPVLLALLMFTLFVIFDTFFTGSMITVFLLMYSIGFQGISFGLFVSTAFRSRVVICAIAGCVIIPLLLISGIIFPIEAMPWFLSQLVKLSPLTLPVDALRSVAFRGWTLSYFGVILGFLVNIGFAIVFLFLSFIWF